MRDLFSLFVTAMIIFSDDPNSLELVPVSDNDDDADKNKNEVEADDDDEKEKEAKAEADDEKEKEAKDEEEEGEGEEEEEGEDDGGGGADTGRDVEFEDYSDIEEGDHGHQRTFSDDEDPYNEVEKKPMHGDEHTYDVREDYLQPGESLSDLYK